MPAIAHTVAARPNSALQPDSQSILRMSVTHRSTHLLDVSLESAQAARDLLLDARRELELEETDPRADDLTIAVARQRVFLAQRRLIATRRLLGFEDDLACECC